MNSFKIGDKVGVKTAYMSRYSIIWYLVEGTIISEEGTYFKVEFIKANGDPLIFAIHRDHLVPVTD
jgi:hypothetical protein